MFTRKLLFSLSTMLLLFTCIPAAAMTDDVVHFNWAILQDTDQGVEAIDFNNPAKVGKNTTLQLYLHPDKGTYVYVFLLDSSNFFMPIFPGSEKYYDSHPPGEIIRIPAGQDRFTIVPPAGQEKFYLLASPTRLNDLEEIMEECIRDPENIESQAKLYKAVRAIRRQNSSLTQVTEKGMPVSGARRNLNQTRGSGEEDKFVATEVEAKGFYSRILRLDHE